MFTRSSPGICPHIQCVALESELSEPLLHPKPEELSRTTKEPPSEPYEDLLVPWTPGEVHEVHRASQARLWRRFEGVNLFARSSRKVHERFTRAPGSYMSA